MFLESTLSTKQQLSRTIITPHKTVERINIINSLESKAGDLDG
jgi:hypothetical protein